MLPWPCVDADCPRSVHTLPCGGATRHRLAWRGWPLNWRTTDGVRSGRRRTHSLGMVGHHSRFTKVGTTARRRVRPGDEVCSVEIRSFHRSACRSAAQCRVTLEPGAHPVPRPDYPARGKRPCGVVAVSPWADGGRGDGTSSFLGGLRVPHATAVLGVGWQLTCLPGFFGRGILAPPLGTLPSTAIGL